MLLLTQLFALDPALGRLDPLLLSDQACLEIAFEGTKRNILKDADGNTIDYVDCKEHQDEDFDENGRIIVLEYSPGEPEVAGLGGSVRFCPGSFVRYFSLTVHLTRAWTRVTCHQVLRAST